jgi:hypothetical protein
LLHTIHFHFFFPPALFLYNPGGMLKDEKIMVSRSHALSCRGS